MPEPTIPTPATGVVPPIDGYFINRSSEAKEYLVALRVNSVIAWSEVMMTILDLEQDPYPSNRIELRDPFDNRVTFKLKIPTVMHAITYRVDDTQHKVYIADVTTYII